MNAPLAILVPSRSRPANIVELLEAWETTAAGGYAELVVAVDLDDPHLGGYLDIEMPDYADLVAGPRLRLGGTLNALAPGLAASYQAVGFMGDDHRPRSLEWDRRLVEALDAKPLGVVYGNDLLMGPALPTAAFLDARIPRTLGYMVPPGMVHLYLDNYWKILGERLGTLTYLGDVIIEHAHPLAGRAEWDELYREVNAPDLSSADESRFRRYVELDLDVAVECLTNTSTEEPRT